MEQDVHREGAAGEQYDVSEYTGRYRGLDLDSDDAEQKRDVDTRSDIPTDTEVRNKVSCSIEEEVEKLRTTVTSQAETIRILNLELAHCNDNPTRAGDTENVSKKRRCDTTEVMNLAMVADSFNKDTQIRELKKEIEILKYELRKHKNVAPPKLLADKSTEPKTARLLPSSQPLPNITELFKDLQKGVEEKITAIEASIDVKLKTIKDDINKSKNGISFASIVSGESATPVSNTADFRTLMRTTRNEEITEEKEKERKRKNVVIHGCDTSDQEKTKKFIETLLTDAGTEKIGYTTVNRIGKVDQPKRPIIVEFNTEHDKDVLMRSLRNLKGKCEYKGISITDDYTVTEREMIKDYKTEAKEMNAKNESEEFFFCVRGTPKNGLYIKKVKKAPAVESTSTEK